jgi:hypothetical protein
MARGESGRVEICSRRTSCCGRIAHSCRSSGVLTAARRPASSNDRHNVRLLVVRNGRAPSSFIDRTARRDRMPDESHTLDGGQPLMRERPAGHLDPGLAPPKP